MCKGPEAEGADQRPVWLERREWQKGWKEMGLERPDRTGPCRPWYRAGFYPKCSGQSLEDFKQGSR